MSLTEKNPKYPHLTEKTIKQEYLTSPFSEEVHNRIDNFTGRWKSLIYYYPERS